MVLALQQVVVQVVWCYTMTRQFCNTFYTVIMMHPITLRPIAIRLYASLQSVRKVASLLDVHYSSISRWLLSPHRKPYVRSKPSISSQLMDSIRSLLSLDPFLSVRCLQTKIKDVLNIQVSRELVRTAILKAGWTRKKAKRFSVTKHLEEQTRTFLSDREELLRQQRPFFALDETSFGWEVTHGYAPRGKPLILKNKVPRQTTSSVLAVMSRESILTWTTSFLSFLEQLSLPAHSVILLDNVRFHYSSKVQELAQQRQWTLLFTPPYSPWFNPIEGIFLVVKRHFCQHASISDAFGSVRPDHCTAFFRHALSLVKMDFGFKI